MRIRPLPHEILVFARCLTRLPPAARPAAAHRIMAETDLAARRFAQTGRPHPRHGDGSLIARLMAGPIPPESYGDAPDYLAALLIAVSALLQHTAASQISDREGGSAARVADAGVGHGRDKTARDDG
jgi:hypothetical protein